MKMEEYYIVVRKMKKYGGNSRRQGLRITMCSRIGRQAASVPEDKSEKLLLGHIRTTQPHRGQSLRSFRVVGHREHDNVI